MLKTSHWYNSPDLQMFLKDPLLETTRRERTSLLGAATVGVLFAHTGLVPQEISVLGIQFSPLERLAWCMILALIVCYFLVAFSLYCVTDYVSWRRAARADLFRQAHDQLSSLRTPSTAPLGSSTAAAQKVGDQYATPYRIESRLWQARCAFDMLLPVALGIYSIVALCWRGLRGS
jgi:hypothetical protein